MLLARLLRLFRRTPVPPTLHRPHKLPVGIKPVLVGPATVTSLPVGLGARRPLVSAHGALAGFEFYVGAATVNRLERQDSESASRACTTNLLGAMRLCTGQQLIALAELPAAWVARCEDDALFAAGMHLVLRADDHFHDPHEVAALVTRLRKTPALLGWNPVEHAGAWSRAGRPDFLPVVAPSEVSTSTWQHEVSASARIWPGVPQVLLDLPDVDLMESVLRPPVLLAACAVGAGTAPAQGKAKTLPPQANSLLQLLNRVVRNEDNSRLAAEIKADAALSLRLLQYMNSAGASPGRELTSIDHVVLMLGRDQLYRWVSQMLVRLSPPRPASSALQAHALARARFLELLALSAKEQNPGSLYLLGLASMLPMLMQCSADEAYASLNLPPQAMQALKDNTGPWQPYLELAHAIERHDMDAANTLVEPFGGIEPVLTHWTNSWLPN